MAEYASLKVPGLKKLLAEKKLPQTGNKADLIARLQEDDSKHAKPTSHAKAASTARATQSIDAPMRAPPAAAAAVARPEPTPTQAAGRTPSSAPSTAAGLAEKGNPTSKPAHSAAEPAANAPNDANPEAKPAASATAFALGLSATPADEEAKKRADRAKRFGMEEDGDAKKRAERAQRFGIDSHDLASGLDAALPERPAKRARGRDADNDGRRPKKRHNSDRKGGRPGKGGDRDARPRTNGPATKGSVLDNPVEKAKAEKRAARFAAG